MFCFWCFSSHGMKKTENKREELFFCFRFFFLSVYLFCLSGRNEKGRIWERRKGEEREELFFLLLDFFLLRRKGKEREELFFLFSGLFSFLFCFFCWVKSELRREKEVKRKKEKSKEGEELFFLLFCSSCFLSSFLFLIHVLLFLSLRVK